MTSFTREVIRILAAEGVHLPVDVRKKKRLP